MRFPHYSVIPSVAEESRGNETLGLFPFLALSMWRREVARQRRREDCCLIFRKSFLIMIILIIELQPSIVTRLLPRANSAQPRRQPFWLCEPFPLSGESTPPLGESKTILFNSAATQLTLPRDVSASST